MSLSVTYSPAMGWPPAAPDSAGLGRSVLLAALLHGLLLLWVGTEGTRGGQGATGSGRSAVAEPLRLHLNGVPAPPGLTAQSGAARFVLAERISIDATREVDRQASTSFAARPTRPLDAATETQANSLPPAALQARPNDAAPELAPVAQTPAGTAFEGALLRGLDSGLPAAPRLSDLQVPPVDPLPLPPPQPWRVMPPDLRPEPMPELLALPAQAAPFRAGAVVLPAAVPPAPPASEALPMPPDALAVARLPALAEAAKPSLPRDELPLQGIPEAIRKRSAASTVDDQPMAQRPLSTASASVSRAETPRVAASASGIMASPSASPLSPLAAETVAATAAPALSGQAATPQPMPMFPLATPLRARPIRLQAMPLETPPLPGPLPLPTQPDPPTLPQASLSAPLPPPVPLAPVTRPPAANEAVPAPSDAVASAPAAAPVIDRTSVRQGSTSGPAPLQGTGVGNASVAVEPGLRGLVNLPPPPTASAAAASAPPGAAVPLAMPLRLNLDPPRRAAVVAPPPVPLRLAVPLSDVQSRLAKDIEKAGKADCRNAHAAKGVLALPALVADAIGKDSGCKW